MEPFEKLWHENYGRMFAFLRRLTGDDHLAEELTQETFYRALRSLPGYRGECGMFTWLAAIAKRVFYRYLRRRRLELSVICPDPVADAWQRACEVPDPGPGTPERAERAAVCAAVRRLVGQLPQKYRDVVLLRLYAGLSFAETGAALGISEGSAKVLYFRAREKLADSLREYADAPEQNA